MKSLSKIELPLETLSELTRVNLGKQTVKATEITDGWFNTIYRLTLSDGTPAVLKMAPPPDFQVMRYERHLMESEVAVLRLLENTDAVPVPRVLAYDATRTVHSHDYFLMECVPGSSLSSLNGQLTDAERTAIYTELGRISASINGVASDRFGRCHPDRCTADSWFASIVAMVDDLLLDAQDRSVELPVSPERLKEAFGNAERELSQVTSPRLVVWDLHPGNVFVENGRITGIIDCDRAIWGDPLLEFLFRSLANTPKAFHEGYGDESDTTDRPGAERCIWLYDLYLAMIMRIECGYRGFEESHVKWTISEFKRVIEIAQPGWL
jgi:aminoglycoside phosphotransferase (APT) family kinase protein